MRPGSNPDGENSLCGIEEDQPRAVEHAIRRIDGSQEDEWGTNLEGELEGGHSGRRGGLKKFGAGGGV